MQIFKLLLDTDFDVWNAIHWTYGNEESIIFGMKYVYKGKFILTFFFKFFGRHMCPILGPLLPLFLDF